MYEVTISDGTILYLTGEEYKQLMFAINNGCVFYKDGDDLYAINNIVKIIKQIG